MQLHLHLLQLVFHINTKIHAPRKRKLVLLFGVSGISSYVLQIELVYPGYVSQVQVPKNSSSQESLGDQRFQKFASAKFWDKKSEQEEARHMRKWPKQDKEDSKGECEELLIAGDGGGGGGGGGGGDGDGDGGGGGGGGGGTASGGGERKRIGEQGLGGETCRGMGVEYGFLLEDSYTTRKRDRDPPSGLLAAGKSRDEAAMDKVEATVKIHRTLYNLLQLLVVSCLVSLPGSGATCEDRRMLASLRVTLLYNVACHIITDSPSMSEPYAKAAHQAMDDFAKRRSDVTNQLLKRHEVRRFEIVTLARASRLNPLKPQAYSCTVERKLAIWIVWVVALARLENSGTVRYGLRNFETSSKILRDALEVCWREDSRREDGNVR
ncbi:hypothetical protein EAI_00875 [Harpegnathos saltator]|uniref:Uncharacterized protein n=1 Tax=Harpegnathos saltator TaxID=610380 RepID=E2BNZ2_HARSA|nr:hypothetical protein EAI_00875 [Harpegnathos saltator]